MMTGVAAAISDIRDDSGAVVPTGIYRAVLDVDGESLCGDIEVR